MGINSTRLFSSNQNSFSRGELLQLIPSTPEPVLFNYLNSGLNAGLTKTQLLSASRYLEHIQSFGWSTYTAGGIYYAYKEYLGSQSNVNFDLFAGNPVRVLIVAGGGGGGGANRAGGGGAGGLIYSESVNLVQGQLYNIIVGAGGSVGPFNNANAIVNGTQGGNSSAFGLTAIGGGFGETSDTSNPGGSGGSGGGAWYGNVGGAGTLGQGNSGGAASLSPPYGSGGGGAGAPGGAANAGQAGGNGLQYNLTGIPTYYAGGGSSADFGANSGRPGGLGGGGVGHNASNSVNANAQQNTGGGGGAGGSGGSGIVIINFSFTIPASFGE